MGISFIHNIRVDYVTSCFVGIELCLPFDFLYFCFEETEEFE